VSEKMFFSGEALSLVLKKYRPSSVIDIGCGDGKHSKVFLEAGCTVNGLDIVLNPRLQQWLGFNKEFAGNFVFTAADFNTTKLSPQKYSCVWASHVLEHQPNVNSFLVRCFNLLEDDGVFAVTVPPAKPNIVGGHLTVWNPGLLLYNMILAGFDCSDAHVKCYGYNISVVVQKKEREPVNLKFDSGDITTLAPFFPGELKAHENFNGIFEKVNWG